MWHFKIFIYLTLSVYCCSSFQGPTCNTATDCMKQAECIEGLCTCGNNYVMSGDWTTCLPVASAAYTDNMCTENIQCTARMNQGAQCTKGRCECIYGYHYFHGECHKSRGYGESCENEWDCCDAYSFDSVTCNENKTCTCAEGYYLVREGYDTCRRSGVKDGDECIFDMDCIAENMFCNQTSNACQTNNPTNSTEDDSLLSDITPVLEPLLETEVGTPCSTDDDCANDAMVCFLDKCNCKKGFSNFANVCKRDLGEPCMNDTDCSHISKGICDADTNTCRCRLPAIIGEDNKQCRPGRLYETQQCQVNQSCTFYGGKAACILTDKRSYCLCTEGNHLAVELQLCIPSSDIQGDCKNDFDCEAGNSTCAESKCKCVDGFHTSGKRCAEDVKDLGDPCLTAEDCTMVIANTTCKQQVCLCQEGYFPSEDEDVCRTGVQGACMDDSDCQADSSLCGEDGRCACDTKSVPSSDFSKCLPVGGYGDPCEDGAQCVDMLGEKGSHCDENICRCKTGYHHRNSYCWETRILGEPCTNNSQCYVKSENFESIFCLNGECTCGYDYIQTENLDCRSGVGKGGGSAVITSACLMIALLMRNWDVRDGWTTGRP